MRRFLPTLLCLLLAATPAAAGTDGTTVDGVCFVPSTSGESCRHMLLSEISRAQHRILVLAYSFTDAGFAAALVRARARGLEVRVVLDKSNVCPPAGAEDDKDDEDAACHRRGAATADRLVEGGVDVRIDRAHPIMHDKVIILDGERTITGSMNLTKKGASRNAENLVVLAGTSAAVAFAEKFAEHWDHSQPYAPELQHHK